MLYTHASELAIRAALFLALQPPGKLSPVREIARGTGLSEPYLAKILRRLTSSGLVRGFRGPGRGMELGRAPEEITLAAVVRAMEGPAQTEVCVLGLRACSEEVPCPLHQQWARVRGEIRRLLEDTTLATLARGARDAALSGKPSWVPVTERANRKHPMNGKKRKAS